MTHLSLFIRRILWAMGLCLWGFSATAQDLQLFGAMEYNDAWYANRVPAKATGVYSFGVPFGGFTAVSPVASSNTITYGAAWYDGYLYYQGGEATGVNANITFNKRNTRTWEVENCSAHTEFPSKNLALSLAINPFTGQMIASCQDGYAQFALRSVDKETGNFTDIATTDRAFTAMAFNAEGVLYGVARATSFPYATTLCTIDPATGAITEIGAMGLNQKNTWSGMACDVRTGKLYWTAETFTYNSYYEETYHTILAEINPATGEATEVATFPQNEQFAAIWFETPHPYAPAAATNLLMANGAFSFTLPTATYSGGNISGTLTAEVSVNGEVQKTLGGLAPGQTITTEALTLTANATNSLGVTLIDDDGHRSLPATLNYYNGEDTPMAVSNLTVTLSAKGDKATLSWTAPATGVNGGPIDAGELSYKIVRNPNAVVVANGIAATTVEDTPDEKMLKSQYTVYAIYHGTTSAPAYSQPVRVGQPYDLPYMETFSTRRGFDAYTTIDANHDAAPDADGDGYPDGNVWLYYAQYGCAIWWLDYNTYGQVADDWMVTPTLNLDPTKTYRLQFETQGWSTGEQGFPTDWKVYTGAEPTQEALDNLIFEDHYNAMKGVKHPMTVTFKPREGDCRIGFHVTNNGLDHISLDNVYVAEYGSVAAPAAASNVSAGENTKGQVVISFTLPTTDMEGLPLADPVTKVTVKNTTTGRVIATIETPEAGATLTATDEAPAAGNNRYTIVADNEAGTGSEAAVEYDTTPDRPIQVENITVTVKEDGTEALVSWAYPDNMLGMGGKTILPGKLRYKLWRRVGNATYNTLIADGISETTYTDREAATLIPENQQQARVTYYVMPVTDGGQGIQTSAYAVLGASYQLPVNENFDFQLNPWIGEGVSGSAQWNQTSKGYSPSVDAADGTGVGSCATYSSGTADYTSPYIDLRGMISPQLTFSRYMLGGAAYGATLQVGIRRYENGIEQPTEMITEEMSMGGTTGWKQETIDLSAYGNCGRAAIVFRAYVGSTNGSVHIDAMHIEGQLPQRDIRVKTISGPTQVVMGRENIYQAEIDNYGTQDIGDISVSLTADGKTVAQQTISLNAKQSNLVSLTWTPGLDLVEGTTTMSIQAEAEGDENPSNNHAEMLANVLIPNLPYVNDLTATRQDDGTVALQWSEPTAYPRAVTVTDDFESYPDCLINGIGPWQTIDADGTATLSGISASIGTFYWENCSKPQAYIVFNPRAVGVDQLATAHSGEKCLVSFTAAGGANDDWLISPQLSAQEQTISFYVQAMHPGYGAEEFEIWTSNAGTDQSDFSLLKEAQNLNGCDWKRIEQTLPQGTRYFAIRCVSKAQFGFMIDDITYQPAPEPCELWGFNVERNGQIVAADHGDISYHDLTALPENAYTYRVNAIYKQGQSVFSEPVAVEQASAIKGLTAAHFQVATSRHAIHITATPHTQVEIADAAGRLIARYRSQGQESIAVNTGIYLVKANGQTLKVIVK